MISKASIAIVVVTCILQSFAVSSVVMAYSYNSTTEVSGASSSVPPGGSVQVTATVQSGCPPFEMCQPLTGTVSWDDGDAGGSFAPASCVFMASQNLSIGSCVATYYAPRVAGIVQVSATYSGNTFYSPGNGSFTVTVGQASSSSSSTSTSSAGGQQPGTGLTVTLAAIGGVVVIVAAAAFLLVRRRKSL